MKRYRNLLSASAAALAIAAIAAPSGGAAAPSARLAAGCTPASNIEAIIDDSGSMAVTDPNRLRVQALDLLINAVNPATTIGAVEFGGNFFEGEGNPPSADPVFNPEPAGANAAAMKAALDAKIHADNGGTDYNAAFNTARAANPGAVARIFLTDGGHDIGTYNNAHLNPAPPQTPTYVVGFSSAIGSPEDQARLQQIANDTGGKFFPLSDSSQLQSVMDEIEAALICQTPPQKFTDSLKAGASKVHTVPVGGNTKSLQIALTWASPLDRFAISGLKITSHGRTLARAARHVRKLKVKTTSSETFTILQVSGLVKGKLSFKVKALTIGSGQPQVTLTTQVGKGH
jgi:hypothetical protein